jgi:hypothetical protein
MEKTPVAAAHDTTCTLWIIGTAAETATTAMKMIGLTPLFVHQTDEETYWQEEADVPDLTTFLARIKNKQANHDQIE